MRPGVRTTNWITSPRCETLARVPETRLGLDVGSVSESVIASGRMAANAPLPSVTPAPSSSARIVHPSPSTTRPDSRAVPSKKFCCPMKPATNADAGES